MCACVLRGEKGRGERGGEDEREREKATRKKTLRALETDIRTYLQTQNGNTQNIFLMHLRTFSLSLSLSNAYTHTLSFFLTHTFWDINEEKTLFFFPSVHISSFVWGYEYKQVVSKECVEHRKVIFSSLLLLKFWLMRDSSIGKIFSLICIHQQQQQQQWQ